MSTFKHLINHVQQYGSKHRILYLMVMIIMFWAVFDGIVTYVAPLIITERGISRTVMGLIIGFSSIAGAVFDLIMCWLFKHAKHRRILLIMFAVCLIYPLLLWQAQTVSIFLLAMMLWGVYYDLHNIANLEFVGRHIEKEEHSSSFGLIQVFQAFGYFLAPILAGLVIGTVVGWKPFALAWVFLLIAIIFFAVFSIFARKEREVDLAIAERLHPRNFLLELSLWHRIGLVIAPVLALTCLLNIVDSFFWTVGPLLAESFSKYHQLAGFFMAAFTLPPLIVGWSVGSMTARYGKKRTAFLAFLLGSLCLVPLAFFQDPIVLISIVFVSSFFISFAWPSINGVYADYISESANLRREIETIEDFSLNLGYIIGPITAGILADAVGNAGAFSALGIVGVIAALILLKITPRRIRISRAEEMTSRFAVVNEIEGR